MHVASVLVSFSIEMQLSELPSRLEQAIARELRKFLAQGQPTSIHRNELRISELQASDTYIFRLLDFSPSIQRVVVSVSRWNTKALLQCCHIHIKSFLRFKTKNQTKHLSRHKWH